MRDHRPGLMSFARSLESIDSIIHSFFAGQVLFQRAFPRRPRLVRGRVHVTLRAPIMSPSTLRSIRHFGRLALPAGIFALPALASAQYNCPVTIDLPKKTVLK